MPIFPSPTEIDRAFASDDPEARRFMLKTPEAQPRHFLQAIFGHSPELAQDALVEVMHRPDIAKDVIDHMFLEANQADETPPGKVDPVERVAKLLNDYPTRAYSEQYRSVGARQPKPEVLQHLAKEYLRSEVSNVGADKFATFVAGDARMPESVLTSLYRSNPSNALVIHRLAANPNVTAKLAREMWGHRARTEMWDDRTQLSLARKLMDDPASAEWLTSEDPSERSIAIRAPGLTTEQLRGAVADSNQEVARIAFTRYQDENGVTPDDVASALETAPHAAALFGHMKYRGPHETRILDKILSNNPSKDNLERLAISGVFAQVASPHQIQNAFDQLAARTPTEKGSRQDFFDSGLNGLVHLATLENAHPDLGRKLLTSFRDRLGSTSQESQDVFEHIVKQDPKGPEARLHEVGQFWKDYEVDVQPEHFAKIQHHLTGRPATITHRGETGHSSGPLPDFDSYAAATQQKLLDHFKQAPNIVESSRVGHGSVRALGLAGQRQIRFINGRPYVRLFRGISGDYGASIANMMGLQREGEGHSVDDVHIKIPVHSMQSWSLSPHIALGFAQRRNGIEGQARQPLVIDKWLPLQDVMHSGMHEVYLTQRGAHPSERELITKHPSGFVTVHASKIYPVSDSGHLSKPKVRQPEIPEEAPSAPDPDFDVTKFLLGDHHADADEGPKVKKSQDNLPAANTELVCAMLGHNHALQASITAAAFMTGNLKPNLQASRQALLEHDGDPDAIALTMFGLEVSPENLAGLQAIKSLKEYQKSEQDHAIHPKEVLAGTKDGEDVAAQIKEAAQESLIVPVQVSGKHSEGALLAQTPNDSTYLLKPGSGTPSPASGVTDEQASQSKREAAFYHVAQAWGLGPDVSRTELLYLDGKEYAAIKLLDPDYRGADETSHNEPALVGKAVAKVLQDGALHQWAMIDYVCGNPDRHGQNVLVDHEGHLRLIDHGSAFAGDSFDPSFDQNSFIPWYLRYGAPKKFHGLSSKDKLRYMPRAGHHVAASLRQWLNGLDTGTIKNILERYGIDPRPSIARLARLKATALTMPVDLAVNTLWAGT